MFAALLKTWKNLPPLEVIFLLPGIIFHVTLAAALHFKVCFPSTTHMPVLSRTTGHVQGLLEPVALCLGCNAWWAAQRTDKCKQPKAENLNIPPPNPHWMYPWLKFPSRFQHTIPRTPPNSWKSLLEEKSQGRYIMVSVHISYNIYFGKCYRWVSVWSHCWAAREDCQRGTLKPELRQLPSRHAAVGAWAEDCWMCACVDTWRQEW